MTHEMLTPNFLATSLALTNSRGQMALLAPIDSLHTNLAQFSVVTCLV